MIRLPSAIDRSRMRPRCRASSAKARNMFVNALVETTATSGPACTYMPPSHSRAIALPTTLTTPRTRAPLRLSSCTAASMSTVSPDWVTATYERVGVDDRVAVAELGGGLGVRRDAGQLLDQLGADHARVVRGAAAEDLDPADRAGLAGVQVQPPRCDGGEPVVDAAAQHPVDRRRAARGSPCACTCRGRPGRTTSASHSTVVGCLWSRRGPRWYVRKSSALRVAISPSSRCTTWRVWATSAASVGGDEHLLLADAEDHRAAVAGDHDPVGEVGVQHGDAVGALDRAQRLADLVLEGVGLGAGDRGGRAPRCRSRRRSRRRRRSSCWRSSAALSMMPLWTTATLPFASMCGCAFTSLAAPCVAQRVWAMPAWPRNRLGSSSPRSRTRPARLATLTPPEPSTATPAES